jgi:hypothetical protein
MSSSYEQIIKSMRDKALEFDGALSKVKRTNDELIAKAQKALDSVGELIGCTHTATPKKCSVCYTRDVSFTAIPCGHTFCESCATRAARSRCHTCRGRVDDTMRVYV